MTITRSCDSGMCESCDFNLLSEWAQENTSQDKQASVKAAISKVSHMYRGASVSQSGIP